MTICTARTRRRDVRALLTEQAHEPFAAFAAFSLIALAGLSPTRCGSSTLSPVTPWRCYIVPMGTRLARVVSALAVGVASLLVVRADAPHARAVECRALPAELAGEQRRPAAGSAWRIYFGADCAFWSTRAGVRETKAQYAVTSGGEAGGELEFTEDIRCGANGLEPMIYRYAVSGFLLTLAPAEGAGTDPCAIREEVLIASPWQHVVSGKVVLSYSGRGAKGRFTASGAIVDAGAALRGAQRRPTKGAPLQRVVTLVGKYGRVIIVERAPKSGLRWSVRRAAGLYVDLEGGGGARGVAGPGRFSVRATGTVAN